RAYPLHEGASIRILSEYFLLVSVMRVVTNLALHDDPLTEAAAAEFCHCCLLSICLRILLARRSAAWRVYGPVISFGSNFLSSIRTLNFILHLWLRSPSCGQIIATTA